MRGEFWCWLLGHRWKSIMVVDLDTHDLTVKRVCTRPYRWHDE